MPCKPENNLEPMGFRFGLEDLHAKQKFRWLFRIDGISASDFPGETNALPPRRSSRPSLSWKEYEAQHIVETIYYPFKPDWKPIPLHLYDVRCKPNPVFDWIRLNERRTAPGLYDPEIGFWQPIHNAQIKRRASLIMLSGCGEVLEEWVFDNCYPQNIEWGELDMDSSEIVTIDLTLRYDRAYIPNPRPRLPEKIPNEPPRRPSPLPPPTIPAPLGRFILDPQPTPPLQRSSSSPPPPPSPGVQGRIG